MLINFSKTEVRIHDGGEYSCELETDDDGILTVVHTVEILGENFSHTYT